MTNINQKQYKLPIEILAPWANIIVKTKVPEVNPNQTETIVNGIRAITGVKSRSEFTSNDTALKIWERLYDEYKSKAV